MKRIRIIVLVFASALAGLFAYANVRELSVTEKLKRVALASFSLDGKIQEGEKNNLEKRIGDLSGVTACSISKEGDAVAVLFYHDVITSEILSLELHSSAQLKVMPKIYASTGGCPVHQIGSSFYQFISLLDLRN